MNFIIKFQEQNPKGRGKFFIKSYLDNLQKYIDDGKIIRKNGINYGGK